MRIDCGCTASAQGATRCRLHDAAPALLAAAKASLHFMATNAPSIHALPHMQNAYEATRKAIAEAEGR